MAASYETGISSSPTNLLQTLVSWLVGQGWTSDMSQADGSGWRAHLHKGSLYVNLRAAENERIWPAASGYHDRGDGGYGIGIYLGTGFDSGAAWHLQASRPERSDGTTAGCGMNLPSGAVAGYHLFDDGADNITVVVERSPGIFCHMGWGPALGAAGQPEAFWYFHGSSSAYRNTDDAVGQNRRGITLTAWPPCSHGDEDPASSGGSSGDQVHSQTFVRVDATTFAGRWVGDGNHVSLGYGYVGRFLRDALNLNPASAGACGEGDFPGYRYVLDRVHQTAYAGALLMPLHVYVETSTGRYAPAGHHPSVYWCTAVGHGFAAKTVYQVGGVDYMLFPHFAVLKGA